MTTIATDGKSIAGDGVRIIDDVIVARGAPKVHRLPDGRVIGFSGTTHAIDVVLAWLVAGAAEEDKPKLEGDSNVVRLLVLSSSGRVEYATTPNLAFLELEAPAAIGSGSDLALGAMGAGASARAAVDVAARFDIATGGVILELEPRDAL